MCNNNALRKRNKMQTDVAFKPYARNLNQDIKERAKNVYPYFDNISVFCSTSTSYDPCDHPSYRSLICDRSVRRGLLPFCGPCARGNGHPSCGGPSCPCGPRGSQTSYGPSCTSLHGGGHDGGGSPRASCGVPRRSPRRGSACFSCTRPVYV